MCRVDCWGWHRRFTLIVVVMVLFVFPLVVKQAFAHKVTIFAWVEGDTVHTESKFSGGRVAKQAPIEVYDRTSVNDCRRFSERSYWRNVWNYSGVTESG